MLKRVLEPELMDEPQEVLEYDEMDHTQVNQLFVADFLTQLMDRKCDSKVEQFHILDLGTGTALIPQILISQLQNCKVTAIDKGANMVAYARKKLAEKKQDARIQVRVEDSCKLLFAKNSFDAIISNSLIHHLPQPAFCLQEAARVLKPNGILFIRDLLRPDTEKQVEQLVNLYAQNETEIQQQFLRQSLQAALTISELEQMLQGIASLNYEIKQTSDRHWSLTAWQTS